MVTPYAASSLSDAKVAELHRLMNEEVKEVAVFFMDVNGVITVWNRASEEMKGYTATDAIGSGLSLFYTAEDKARGWPAHNLEAAKENGFYREESWRQRKDGTLFWARVLLTMLKNHSGEHIGFSKITFDLTEHKLLERCVKEREETRKVLSAAQAGMWTWDPDTCQINVCQNFLALLGYPGEDMILPFARWLSFVHPSDQRNVQAQFESALVGTPKRNLKLELQLCLKNGTSRWFSVRADWHQEQTNSPFVLKGICIDIQDLKTAEEALAQKTRRLEFTLDSARIGEWDLDLLDNRSYRSLRHDQCFGYTEQIPDWGFDKFVRHIHPDDRMRVVKNFDDAIAGLNDWHFECRVIWPDGSLHWIEAHGSVYGASDKANRMVGIVSNITERKEAEERVRHASLHDPLTGLPNRAMLFEYARRLLPHNRPTNKRAAVLLLDLDRLKPINDSHRHETGDQVIKEVAVRLLRSLCAEDIVVRLGGDEFLIVLKNVEEAACAAKVAAHILAKINEPYQIGELTLSLSTSIGISIFPDDGQDLDTLITHADAALHQVKRNGRNNFQFFSSELVASARLLITIEQQLKSALSTDAFYLYYQPVVDLESGDIVSVEALLRWSNAEIGPERFVPVAEATGIINPIGRWVLQEASRQHKVWIANGLQPIPIAVNVSAVEFRDKDFVTRFEQLIKKHDIEPAALQLELTETAVMDDIDYAITVLTQLQQMGVKILLDDFGTGHSSLAYLARLPINKIKIDKSFILRLENDGASRVVIDAMLALGRTLGLEVVAEGIESQAALDYVRAHGCQQAQGYYFSPPMSGAAFKSWYATIQQRTETYKDHSNQSRLGNQLLKV